ncbi:unnamed protein product, partial [Dovyalis caffra]
MIEGMKSSQYVKVGNLGLISYWIGTKEEDFFWKANNSGVVMSLLNGLLYSELGTSRKSCWNNILNREGDDEVA